MSANMLGEALRTVCGPLGDLNQKLSGPNGEEWLVALKRFLRRENPWDGKLVKEFPVWKVITLGTFKDVKSLKKALEKNGFRVSDWANDILGQPAFTLATKKIEVNLVKTTVADLGFPKGTTLQEIYVRARELGLGICPAEVGPQLRLQYPDQPRGEWLRVAMEPVTGSDGCPYLFRMAHDRDERWLSARWSDPDSFWAAAHQFVFVSK